MNKCPFCYAENSVGSLGTPANDEFMLISYDKSGNFSIPPKGIIVNALGCTKCGHIILGNPNLVNQQLYKGNK